MPLFPSLTALARNFAAGCASSAILVTAAQATTFVEVGDAGQTQAAAQTTFGAAGALTDIFGTMSSSFDIDLYVINIATPGTFSASTVNAGSGTLDTQIFLLTLAGAPIILNDDAPGGLSVLSTLPVGSFTLAAGNYLIGVGESGYDPKNINGQLLFAAGLSTSVRGAASGLQPAVLGGYADDTYELESGGYDLKLTGATVANVVPVGAVPEPSTYALMLLGVGALGLVGKRRRADAGAVRSQV